MKKATAAVAVIPTAKGLSETRVNEVTMAFESSSLLMHEYQPEFDHVMALKQSPERSKEAKILRLKYVKVRTGADKVHKPLKAVALAVGNYIDSYRNGFKVAASKNEDALKHIEDYETIKVQKQVTELERTRKFDLAEYDMTVYPPNLGEFPEEVWDTYLAGVKAKYKQDKEDKLALEKQAKEQARIDMVKADELSEIKRKLKDATAKAEQLAKHGPAIVVDAQASDQDKAITFARDLKQLRYKYEFSNDVYRFAYGKACERFERIEEYFTKTINISSPIK